MTYQSLKALARANDVRLGRAQVRRDIREGKRSVLDALADPTCASATLASLLKAQYRWGPIAVGTLLNRLSVSHSRRVEDLTTRQRDLLRDALESRR